MGPISFDVYPGEHISLLGPSGCGKTTTLRSIAGFEALTSGSIWLSGARLDNVPPHKRGVGYVFQQYSLFPHLSVFDNVAFGLRLARVARGDIERRVSKMLEMVELGAAARRLPRELSGGQQQRVAIARAVVMEPRVILFDEPLSNLDYKLRILMRQQLRDLQRNLGKTTIYVTHDQTEALAMSDRIAVLSQGRIEQIGTPREIYERPATSFVADFMGNANLIRGRILDRRPGRATIVLSERIRLLADWSDDSAGSVLVVLRPEHIRIQGPQEIICEAENYYAATITETTYLGDSISLLVHLEDGIDLTLVVKATARHKALSAGQAITIVIAAADVHVIAA